tara:strand:- start:1469 stop:2020 length:552 start_codon:yes stop_codon:yes gene_type:complete
MKKIIQWHKNWCEKWRLAMKMSHYATYWVSFFKGVLLVLLLLALVGCSGVPKTVTYEAKPIDRQNLILPDLEPLDLADIDWFVVTPENAEESFEKLKNEKLEIVFFAITEKGYEKLSINNQKMLKMLSDQKAVIMAYKKYYEDTENNIETYNKNNSGKKEIEVPQSENNILGGTLLKKLNPFD